MRRPRSGPVSAAATGDLRLGWRGEDATCPGALGGRAARLELPELLTGSEENLIHAAL